MDIIEAISAAGWMPAVLLAGHWLAAQVGVDRPVDRWVLAPAVGLVLWTLPMLVAAALGLYRPWFFGLVGWALTAGLIPRIEWSHEFRQVRLSGVGWLVVVLTLAFGALSLVTSSESFLGGRDQGGYANHALHIARTGSVWVAFPFETFGEGRFGPLHFLQNLSNLGFTPDRMEGQFPPVYTIWMAQIVGVFGRTGVLGFNPVLAALSIPLVYRLARQFLGRPAALLALLVFALNPAQLWMARITLSEISAQHMMAASMLLLVSGWRLRKQSIVALGALLLGAFFWIRIDGLVFAPALAAVYGALLIWGQRDTDDGPSDLRLMATVGWITAGLFLVGGLFYATFTGQYFMALSPMWLRLGGVALVLALAATLLRHRELAAGISRALSHRFVVVVALALLTGLLFWAYWIRPVTEPFALLDGMPERGRSYREDSLVNLVIYLSEPAAWLGLIGLMGAVWGLLSRRIHAAWILPLGLWGAFAALYLYNPSISPDHIWAMRRFLPVVIPGCALLVGFGFQLLFGRPGLTRFRPWFAAAACLILVVTLLDRSSLFLFFKENRGTEEFLASVDEKIRPGSLVFADTGTLFFDPFYPGLGQRIIRVDLDDRRMPYLIEAIIAENVPEGETVYYLTQTPRDHLLMADETYRIPFAFDFIAPTVTPLPKTVGRHTFNLNLYACRVAPNDPEKGYGNVTIGHSQVTGIEESGFHGNEANLFGPFRWTDGRSRLKVPLRDGYRPRSIALEIGDGPPDGSDLILRANGTEIYRQSLTLPTGRLEVDLPADFDADTLDLEIVSGYFVPAEIPGRGNDQRHLGLCLYGVTLSDQPVSKGIFRLGTEARDGVAEGGFHGSEVNELGPYRWTDGAAWLKQPLPEGYVLRRLELEILDMPPGGCLIEVQLDGQPVYRESHTEAPEKILISIDDFEPAEEGSILRVDLLSDSFCPADQGGGPDTRSLGLRVHGITVSDRRAVTEEP